MSTIFKIIVAFLFTVVFILATLPIFAAQEIPKKGDVIQLLIGGYGIEAQVISITPPSTLSPEQTKKAEQPSQNNTATAGQASETEKSTPSNLQEQYNAFAENNPVKTGIESFQNNVNDQVAKWYQLAANKANLPTTAALPKAQIDPRALFAGLAIIGAIILFWLFKKSRKHRYKYDDSSGEEE